MNVKKSNIIIISVLFTLLMWCAWNLGIKYGLNRSLATQKPDRSYAMQNEESGTEGFKTPVIRIEARQIKQYTDAMISQAIWYAEGGSKAKFLYGIRSVKYSSPEKARLACLQTVRNNRERWIKAGCPGDFISFLGQKYCPPQDHPLNIHWVGNVYKYLRKKE